MDQFFNDRLNHLAMVLVQLVTVYVFILDIFNKVPRNKDCIILLEIERVFFEDLFDFFHSYVLFLPLRFACCLGIKESFYALDAILFSNQLKSKEL